jgi:hypothetical protein
MIPHLPAVWNEQTNLGIGLDRLARTRASLEARGVLSYRLLWAAHHNGFEGLAAGDLRVERLPEPADPIARAFCWVTSTRLNHRGDSAVDA